MRCPHCGAEVNVSEYCANCGARFDPSQIRAAQNAAAAEARVDRLGCGLSFCCILVWFLGFILYGVWRSRRPQAAKTALRIAIVMVIIEVVGGIVSGIIASTYLLPYLEEIANSLGHVLPSLASALI
jgi:hypothetical protein